MRELQRARSGGIEVVLLAGSDALPLGKGAFALEFRDAGGTPVNVGTVRVNAAMAMAGMAPMLGDLNATASSVKGRYDVVSNLSMAGTWRLTVEWDGAAGRGSASMPGTVR